MFDEDKLEAIREYLKHEFNSSNIIDKHDIDRDAQTFNINGSGKLYIVTVEREFIDDNDADTISHIMGRYALKNSFKNPKVKRLVFVGEGEWLNQSYSGNLQLP